ncbi:sensor domain-containing diguanylate cyclase [Paractinoplanes atraurantiacus]|uniref:Diguanylate cyclase (GGDEF) domain-containing protein n=1 Tax=Paractinoplanes atraurantiacus TaxID=1036182 RepID=A0A285KMC3_9ACTN|nr:sensor domain-containing diguanylate cyclase [Actinoplanes atraurantiacus]SNY73778.1 diguanylate cyclase (GGDEF) domain-containing protein [Actinoplanes atraurantiacus]
MSVSSEIRPLGPEPVDEPQEALLAALVAFMTKDTPSVQHVLDLTRTHLERAAGLTAATVFELDSETGLLFPTAQLGEPGKRDTLTAGKVFRLAAGAAPKVTGEQMPIRLRIGGQTVGVLLLTGSNLDELRPDVLAVLALHFATTLQGLAAEKQRQWVSHNTAIIRRLFEEGMAATSVEAAGRILAGAAADGFRTEHAAVFLIDAAGKIDYVHGVNLPGDDSALATVLGQAIAQTPIWQAIKDGKVSLVNDAATANVLPNGPVRSMGMKSYIAMPLMSTGGPVGMILCGDSSAPREWTFRDRIFAEQLSVEGTLIVDSAGMRQAAQAHVAQLSHQAFHDSLTGLPNRSYLIDRAERVVTDAASHGGQVALMVLDLNGFKQVNDTEGHQAGDVLLQQVAKRLLGAVRDDDVVSRLGGDEFAILLTRDPDDTVAAAVADRICDRLREPFTIEGQQVTVGGSVGYALFPEDATDYEALMKGADAAMYEAKRDTKKYGGGKRRARPQVS